MMMALEVLRLKGEKENVKTLKDQNKKSDLLLKIVGEATIIYRFLSELPKIIPGDSMTVSQLLENKGEPGHHLFVKINVIPKKRL